MNAWEPATRLKLRLSAGPDKWAPVYLENGPFSVLFLVRGEHAGCAPEFAARVRLALAVVEGMDDDDLEYALGKGLTYRELGRIIGEGVSAEGEQD